MTLNQCKSLLDKLRGGPLSSIGRADEVVSEVLENPRLFATVFSGLFQEDPVLRARCADVAEKVSRSHPENLRPLRRLLLERVAPIAQQEVRWHAAQMLGYLDWSPRERRKVIGLLEDWLKHEKSRIVKVMALQSMADLARSDKQLKATVAKRLEAAKLSNIPSLASRARKILKAVDWRSK